jgi:DNA-binding SARP family transcriptional activator
VAGAGHGKTTLLVQALTENRLTPRGDDVWLVLDRGDEDAEPLARDLLLALGVESAEPSAAAIADAVWRRAPTEVCLVLDDAHLLSPGSDGGQLLASLVDLLPANGHLVVAGRTRPTLPQARVAAQGGLLRIDEADLRFDDDELRAFASARGVDPDTLDRAAGWPAMAELLASAGADLTGDFLWEEVLEPLGAEQRQVLSVLCDLGGGDARLLTAALGQPASLDAPVPLVAVDAHGWHAPHALWGSVPAIALPDPTRREVRHLAAQDLIARDRLDDAYALLAEVDLWDDVPDLLRAACRSGMHPTAGQLRRWLAQTPESVRHSPPGLLATGVLASLTNSDQATEPLRAAVEHFREVGDVDGELCAMSHLGHLAWWRGDLAVLGELLPRTLELEATGNEVASGFAAFGRAVICDIQADPPGVLDALAAVRPGVLDPRWEAVMGWLRARAQIALGDGPGSHASLVAALECADPVFRVTVEATLTVLRWAAGEIANARAESAAIMAAADSTGITQQIAVVAASAARACAQLGDLSLASQHLARARQVVGQAGPSAIVQVSLAEATVAAGEGDEERAVAVLREALAQHPLDDVRARGAWGSGVAVAYVLLEEVRSFWDEVSGPPVVLVVRDLAAAVVAGRESNQHDPIRSVDVSNPWFVIAALPLPFTAELVVRLHDAGRAAEGMAILELLGEPGRDRVRALGTRAAKALLGAVPAAPSTPVRVQALGPVLVDGREVDRVRVRELLGYLLLHRTTTRAEAMAVLWPDLDDKAGANNLRVTLSHLLHLIEPDRAEGEAAYTVRLGGSELRLVSGAGLDVDLDAFDTALIAAQRAEHDGSPSVALDELLRATELYRGDLLADLPDIGWADIERESHRSRFVVAAVRAAELLTASNQLEQAEALAQRALAADEWAEAAYGVLASVALARGDRGASHRVLERSQAMLADLGVEPSEATRRLLRRARATDV